MDFFNLLFADFGDAIENESSRNTVGNAVAESHKHTCEEGGNGFVEIVPFDLFERGHHHDAHNDQSGSSSGKGNRADKSCQKSAEGKAHGNDHAGEAGTAACADTRGTLYESGGVAGAENSADGSCGGVSEERTVHLGLEAGIGLHCFFVLITEDAGPAASADKCADGVESIGDAEGEDSHQHQGKLCSIGEQRGQTSAGEDSAKRGGQSGTGFREADSVAGHGDAHGDAEESGDDDPDKDGALHVAYQQDDGQYQTDEEQPKRRLVQSGERRHTRTKVDDAHVQEAQVGDENADAAADSVLQAAGDGLDDEFTQLGHCNEDVDQAADKYHGQRLLPGKAQSEAYCVDEERV